MLATLGTRADVNENDWAIEMRWDGIRAIATLGPDAVTFTSRNGNDLTGSSPDLAEMREAADDPLLEHGTVVLDGEIVVFDSQGRSDFGLIQTRMNLSGGDARTAARRHPAVFVVFDLLEADDESLIGRSWSDRRALLEKGVTGRGPIEVSPVFDGDADAAIAASIELGLEGIVAKKRASTYAAGRRSGSWIKVKNSLTQEVVIGGWRPGRGHRAGRAGPLLLGVPGDGSLHYVGRVGSGFSDRALDELAARFSGLECRAPPSTTYHGSTRPMRTGPPPRSSERSRSPSGRRQDDCVIPPGADGDQTRTRPMSCGKLCDKNQCGRACQKRRTRTRPPPVCSHRPDDPRARDHRGGQRELPRQRAGRDAARSDRDPRTQERYLGRRRDGLRSRDRRHHPAATPTPDPATTGSSASRPNSTRSRSPRPSPAPDASPSWDPCAA